MGYRDTSRRSPTLVLVVANCCECISVQIEHNSDRCHGEMYFDIVDYAMLGVLRGGNAVASCMNTKNHAS